MITYNTTAETFWQMPNAALLPSALAELTVKLPQEEG